MKNTTHRLLFCLLLAASFMLRFWGVADVPYFSGDQGLVIPAAHNFLENGFFEPDSWEHPPMKYFLIQGSMKVFGDNAYGWRMKNVIFGTLSVCMLFLLAQVMFSDARISLLALTFMAFDPLHIFFSRSVLEEIPATFFLLSGAYVTVRYLKGRSGSPLLAGISLGLALAHKWYFFPALAVLGSSVIFHKIQKKELDATSLCHTVSVYTVLPAGIYMLGFYPWFKRGYGLSDFLGMQMDAFRELQSQTIDTFPNAFLRTIPSLPWDWFTKPLINGIVLQQDGVLSRILVFMNNPPVWLLVLPAALFAAWRGFRSRNGVSLLALLLFCSMYLQFLLVNRALFLYSALVILPFGFILSAQLLSAALDKAKFRGRGFLLLLTGFVLWGLYLYPLATNRLIPLSLYAPLFAVGSPLAFYGGPP